MRLLFSGPPGAGKGTQAAVIAAKLDIPAISTGDIFRANVKSGTPLGIAAKHYMDAGEFVPDEVTNAMVDGRLSQADCAKGFLLDGYPRTLDQVQVLDELLAKQDAELDAAVLLQVDDELLVQRLLKRALVDGRADDTESVIRHRLDLYRRTTAPLAARYASRGLLSAVDGAGEVAEVTERILAVLAVSATERRA